MNNQMLSITGTSGKNSGQEQQFLPALYTMGGRGGGNQAYSRLSTTHGHITDCKLDSVVYAGVRVVI